MVFLALILAAQAVMFAWAFGRSLAAATAAVLFVLCYPLEDGTCTWPSTEHFANLFVSGVLIIALLIMRDRSIGLGRCLAAGRFAAAAFHVRQNAILCGLMPALAVLLSGEGVKDQLRAVAALAVGAVAVCGLMLGIMAACGDVPGYFYTVFLYPRVFADAGGADEVRLLARYFLGTSLAQFMGLFAAIAADSRYWLFVVGLIVLALASCVLPMRNHPHYLANTLPYVALLIGMGTQRLAAVSSGLGWASAAVMAAILVPAAVQRMSIVTAEPNHDKLAKVAQTVDELRPPRPRSWYADHCRRRPYCLHRACRRPIAIAGRFSFSRRGSSCCLSPWRRFAPTTSPARQVRLSSPRQIFRRYRKPRKARSARISIWCGRSSSDIRIASRAVRSDF